MGERTMGKNQPIVIGDRGATFPSELESARHVLFAPAGGAYTINLASGMSAEVNRSDKKVEKVSSGSVTVSEGDWGIVRHGETAYYFQFVTPEAAVIGGSAAENEYYASTVTAFFVHVAVMILLLAWLPPFGSGGQFDQESRLVRIMIDDPVGAIEELEEEDAPDDETTSAAAGGEEGRFGEEDALVEDSVLPDHDGPLVDEITETELGTAMNAAIGQSGALTNIFGQSNAFSDSFGADFATAGTGDALIVGRGVGGMGMRGTGRGGGGDGLGRVHGVGGIDTGSGRGQGASLGRRGQVERRARVQMSAPQSNGFCSREMIERVVRRHQRGIRFCYERELQSDPELSGRVTANWTIGLDGSVVNASITENSMGNRNVESCMVAELRRMRFDQPDGGQCIISFPFSFRSE
jgi:hypothetical protein